MQPNAQPLASEVAYKSRITSWSQLIHMTPERAALAMGAVRGITIDVTEAAYRLAQARGLKHRTATDSEVACSDFKRDPLGRYHAVQSGMSEAPTSALYKLISNRRVGDEQKAA